MNQIYKGKVVGLKNPKTVSVELFFNLIHPKYHKPFKFRKKIQAHNENFQLSLGEEVVIKNSKPYSATKKFLVIEKTK